MAQTVVFVGKHDETRKIRYQEACDRNDFLSDGSKDQTINAILDWAGCILKEEQSRVGKYFCFVENTAGIQYNKDGSTFLGQIKPLNEKFFVEIKEWYLDNNLRRKTCENTAFGLLSMVVEDGKMTGNFSSYNKNYCLANYFWKFSVDLFTCAARDTYQCSDYFFGTFSMNNDNHFDWFKKNNGDHTSIYVSQGKCEKID